MLKLEICRGRLLNSDRKIICSALNLKIAIKLGQIISLDICHFKISVGTRNVIHVINAILWPARKRDCHPQDHNEDRQPIINILNFFITDAKPVFKGEGR